MPTRKAKRGSSVRVRGEKQVNETDATLPVKPVRVSAKAKEPLVAPAVDRRKQFSGTDEPKNRTR